MIIEHSNKDKANTDYFLDCLDNELHKNNDSFENIEKVFYKNDLDIDIGETADASNATVSITGASGSDSNVVAATIDGTSAILTLTVNGDTNNYLIDINGDGDVNGHTLIHTHTESIADVDITQSGVYDKMITLITYGDKYDIDISKTDLKKNIINYIICYPTIGMYRKSKQDYW